MEKIIMRLKHIVRFGLLLTLAIANNTQALEIKINPSQDTFFLGEQGKANININIDKESFGGTFEISYDSHIINNLNFEFLSSDSLDSYGIQSEFSKVEQKTPEKMDISFGTLSFSKGVSGTGLLGILTFDTVGTGETEIVLKDVLGGFNDFNSYQKQHVDYSSANISVVNSVPLPTAFWLFGSAFVMLFAKTRVNS